MRSGTLDQKPEDANGPDQAGPGDVPPSGGGFLGRWRAGVTPQGATYENEKPLWRRILVGFLLWTGILGFGFVGLSLLAVFTIQQFVVREFRTFLTVVIDVGDAHHVSRRLTGWVVTAILTLESHTINIQCRYLGGLLRRDATLDVEKLAGAALRLTPGQLVGIDA